MLSSVLFLRDEHCLLQRTAPRNKAHQNTATVWTNSSEATSTHSSHFCSLHSRLMRKLLLAERDDDLTFYFPCGMTNGVSFSAPPAAVVLRQR